MLTCKYPDCESSTENENLDHCGTHGSLLRKLERQAIKDAEKSKKAFSTIKPKRQKPLAKHSEDVHYTTSDTGERVSRAEAERRIRKTKAQLLGDMMYEYDYIFCQHKKEDGKECGKSCDIRDCSHEVSILECINSGQIELSWWIGNFKVRCREHHNEWDKSGLQWKSNEKI